MTTNTSLSSVELVSDLALGHRCKKLVVTILIVSFLSSGIGIPALGHEPPDPPDDPPPCESNGGGDVGDADRQFICWATPWDDRCDPDDGCDCDNPTYDYRLDSFDFGIRDGRKFRLPKTPVFPGGLGGGGGAGAGCEPPPPPPPNDDPPPKTCDIGAGFNSNAPKGGASFPASTGNPIYLRFGTVVEGATDLSLAGPGVSWTQARSYNSGLEGAGVLGNRWITSNTETYLVTTASGIDWIYTASSKISFTGDDTNGYTGPPDRRLTLEHKSGEYWLTNPDTGALAIFHDFNVSTELDRGRLKEATSEAWEAAGKTGITYEYTYSAGLLNTITITTSGAQACSVTSSFDSGLLKSLSVTEGTTLTKKVEYFYYDDLTTYTPSTQAGSSGDLMQVRVSTRAADDTGGTLSIVRDTLYRYASGSRLKAVYSHGDVMRALDHFTQSNPQWLLSKDDDYNGGSGPKIEDFASRWFTYYSSNVGNSSMPTLWVPSGEDFSAYGNRDETNFVATERVNSAACTSCGGSASGITHGYYYLELDQGTTNDDNEVKYLIVEDTKDSTGVQYRKIFGLNADGRKLREVLIDNPTSSPKYWCQSWKLVTTSEYGTYPKQRYHIQEYRPPSAHNVTSTNVSKFLDPFDDGNGGSPSWTNDTDTLRTASDSAAGPTYLFSYDSNGRQTEKRVKRGWNASSVYFLKATDYGNGTNAPPRLPVKIYQYAAPVTTKTATPHIEWSLSYSFWDPSTKLQIKKATTTYPTISTGQNGSGTTVTAEQWYDKAGRLRWSKDAEGYITYYSYYKNTGQLGYTAVDVNPGGSAPTGATDSTWVSWTEDGDGNGTYDSSGIPSRDGSLPTALALVTRQEYDIQGRPTLRTNPGGDRHYTLYESDRTIDFPYLDGNGKPQMPTRVRVANDLGQTVDEFSVRANYTSISSTGTGGVPTGFSSEPTQSDYVRWTRYAYDDQSSNLLHVDTYFNIPSSGGTSDNDLSTYYYRTAFQYDVQGRRVYTIQQVSGKPGSGGNGVEQVSQVVYDKFGRVSGSKRGVSSASHNMGTDYSTLPTMATLSNTYYDGGGASLAVGDGRISSVKSFFGTGTFDYTLTHFYYTWRGHQRAVSRANHSGGTILPWHISSLDWSGRTIVSAEYTNASTWATVLIGSDQYADYISTTTTDRYNLTKTSYDDLGRAYRTLTYPGSEGTKHFETNNYYDRKGQLVATGQKYQAQTEYAYDGAGREYQIRTVVKLEDDDATYGKYSSSGAFNYVEPAPHPSLASMDTNGDDGLIEFTHTVYDSSGNDTEYHTFELNSFDSNGIDIDSTTSYVRSTQFTWYDALDRPTSTANYGSGDGTSSPTTWSYSTRPSRPSELNWTYSTVYNGYVQLTKYGYDSTTGGPDTVTTGVSKNGMDTKRTATKAFYDDAGRQIAVSQNYVNYNASADTGAGGGTNNEDDRVTKWQYNGLGQVTKLTAVNVTPSSGTVDEETKYYYEDPYNASLVTHTVYPDSTDTPSSGTDLVKLEYNLDGSLKKKTDQRQVIMEYTYDDARRVILEGATTIPGTVDGAIKSIGRTYDSLGRPEKITSYANANGTGTIQNEVKNTYGTDGQLATTEQSHQDAVSSSPSVQYAYDDTATSNVYTNGLRLKMVTYPAGRKIHSTYGSSGSIADVLSRVNMYEADSSGSPGADLVVYSYNGTSRLAKVDYTDQDLDAAVRTSFGWDRFGRTVSHEWQHYHSGTTVRDRFDYTYDYADNQLTRNSRVDLINGTYTDNHDQLYSYDELQRLKDYDQGTWSGSAITSSNKQRSWELDQLSNWAQTFSDVSQSTSEQTRGHNAVNEITSISNWTNPVYDDAGNATTIPQTDGSGSYTLKYDAWNRLVEVKDGSNTVQTNEYNGLGQRIVRSVYDSGSLDHRIHYYYNEGWQVLEERKEVSSNEDSDPLNQYLWHPYYIDALAIRWYDPTTIGSVSDYYYLQDANYNVTAVTNNTGDIVERYAYSPYGDVTVLNANFSVDADGVSDIGNTHLYTGRERDPETGLQLNRHRLYASHLGRWLTRDPIEYVVENFNLYSYASNSPNSRTDPFGLASLACRLNTPVGSKGFEIPLPIKDAGQNGGCWQASASGTCTFTGLVAIGRGCPKGAVRKAEIDFGLIRSVECLARKKCPGGQICSPTSRIEFPLPAWSKFVVPVSRTCIVVGAINCSFTVVLERGTCCNVQVPDDDNPFNRRPLPIK